MESLSSSRAAQTDAYGATVRMLVSLLQSLLLILFLILLLSKLWSFFSFSILDLLVATVNMPVTVYTIIVGRWTLSDDACVATGFINMLTLVTSVLSLCNISINRYFMVCHPAKFKDIYTPRNAILMISGKFKPYKVLGQSSV